MSLELGVYTFGNTPPTPDGGFGPTPQAIRDSLSPASHRQSHPVPRTTRVHRPRHRTVLLALICVSSASMKLGQTEQVLAVFGGTVGVPTRYFPVLAGLELGGHLRVGDTKNVAMPLPPLVLAIAVLVLRLLTL